MPFHNEMALHRLASYSRKRLRANDFTRRHSSPLRAYSLKYTTKCQPGQIISELGCSTSRAAARRARHTRRSTFNCCTSQVIALSRNPRCRQTLPPADPAVKCLATRKYVCQRKPHAPKGGGPERSRRMAESAGRCSQTF